MVMADREGVKSTKGPIAWLTLTGLASNMLNGIARVPFSKPWQGPAGVLDNLGQSTTRQAIRSFMGYTVSLPIEDFRYMEKVLDDVCGLVLPPIVGGVGQVEIEPDIIGGVEGIWCREKHEVRVDDDGRDLINGTLLYLHGGGYIGTTPMMYTMFAAALVRITGCEIFIPDYRMAPEFPFPAAVLDAADVYVGLLDRGVPSNQLLIAGDSGGGGLATSLIAHLRAEGLPRPGALALFSPEVSLELDSPSMTENAGSDVLPWSIPVTPYLQGVAPGDARVSATHADPEPDWWPPTFVAWGGSEMFRDGIREFAQRIRDSDVPLAAMEEEGMFHVFPILMPWAESSKRVFAALRELAKSHVTQGDPTT